MIVFLKDSFFIVFTLSVSERKNVRMSQSADVPVVSELNINSWFVIKSYQQTMCQSCHIQVPAVELVC